MKILFERGKFNKTAGLYQSNCPIGSLIIFFFSFIYMYNIFRMQWRSRLGNTFDREQIPSAQSSQTNGPENYSSLQGLVCWYTGIFYSKKDSLHQS